MNVLGKGKQSVVFAGRTTVYVRDLPQATTNGGSTDLFNADITFPSESEWITKGGHVECVGISSCDKIIAVADSLHGLHLFRFESSSVGPSWTKVFQGTISKRVIKLLFTSDSRFLTFLDKQGDIHAVQISSASKIPAIRKIMGHTSFISDYVIRNDCTQIVSCDRDEKIRISNFPDAFEIQGFCLGHTESVISVNFFYLERDEQTHTYLLSISTAGVLMMWNFDNPTTGTNTNCLKMWNVMEMLPEGVRDCVIKSAKSVSDCLDKINLCISFTGTAKVFVFEVSTQNFGVKLLQELETDSDNHCLEWISTNQLLLYTPNLGKLKCWSVGDSSFSDFKCNLNESSIADMKALTDGMASTIVPMRKRVTNVEDNVAVVLSEQSVNKKVKA